MVCKPGDIICRDGTCVDISKRCDGKNDCAEGIDETNCGMLIIFHQNYWCIIVMLSGIIIISDHISKFSGKYIM